MRTLILFLWQLGSPTRSKGNDPVMVPLQALEMAIQQVKTYLKFRDNEDLDNEDVICYFY